MNKSTGIPSPAPGEPARCVCGDPTRANVEHCTDGPCHSHWNATPPPAATREDEDEGPTFVRPDRIPHWAWATAHGVIIDLGDVAVTQERLEVVGGILAEVSAQAKAAASRPSSTRGETAGAEAWPACKCGHPRARHVRQVLPGCIVVYHECCDFDCDCPTYCHDGRVATPVPPQGAKNAEPVAWQIVDRTDGPTGYFGVTEDAAWDDMVKVTGCSRQWWSAERYARRLYTVPAARARGKRKKGGKR